MNHGSTGQDVRLDWTLRARVGSPTRVTHDKIPESKAIPGRNLRLARWRGAFQALASEPAEFVAEPEHRQSLVAFGVAGRPGLVPEQAVDPLAEALQRPADLAAESDQDPADRVGSSLRWFNNALTGRPRLVAVAGPAHETTIWLASAP